MSKYGNRKTTTARGTFDSQYESQIERDLYLRLRAHDIAKYECQYKIPLTVNGKLICHYVVDFMVTHYDGSLEAIEAKGMMTAVAAIKIKLFKALYPEIKFTLEQL